MQFRLGTVLQHSSTPSLRVAGFEDEDEDSLSSVANPRHWHALNVGLASEPRSTGGTLGEGGSTSTIGDRSSRSLRG